MSDDRGWQPIETAPRSEDKETLEKWRCERLREAEQFWDTLPPGLYRMIAEDTPEAMAERMRRNLL